MILSILEFTSVKYFAGSITVTDFALNMGFLLYFPTKMSLGIIMLDFTCYTLFHAYYVLAC